MTFKNSSYILLLTVFFLSGCGVSTSDSNIQYNQIYENIKIESVGCGKGNQLTYEEDGEKIRLNLSQVDCLYLLEHRKHLKLLGEDENFNISFISNGEFIDGIIINEQ